MRRVIKHMETIKNSCDHPIHTGQEGGGTINYDLVSLLQMHNVSISLAPGSDAGSATWDEDDNEGDYLTGTNVTIDIDVAAGYELVSVIDNSDTESSDYLITSIDDDHVIVVATRLIPVDPETYNVGITLVGDAGSATFASSTDTNAGTYDEGTDVTIDIDVASGYELVSVVDNTVTQSSDYTISAINVDHAIVVATRLIPDEPETYNVGITLVGDAGSATFASAANTNAGTYDEGTDVTIDIDVALGYELVSVVDNAVSQSSDYTISAIDMDHAIFVYTRLIPDEPETYNVGITLVGDAGSATFASATNTNAGTYDDGTDVTIDIDVASGYELVSVIDNSLLQSSDYTISAINVDHAIVVTTRLIPVEPETYNVGITLVGDAGSATFASATNTNAGTYDEGTDVTIDIDVTTGYELVSVVDNTVPQSSDYTISAIDVNHAIVVTTRLIPEEPVPSITVVKSTDPLVYKVGDQITYTFTITNNGDVDFGVIRLTDDLLGLSGVNLGELLVDGVIVETETYLATEANPGLTNYVTVGGYAHIEAESPLATDDSEVTVEINPLVPSIEVVKSADKSKYEPGETVTYNFTVTNNGKVDFGTVIFEDAKLGIVEFIEPLNIGDVWTYSTTTSYSSEGYESNTATVDAYEDNLYLGEIGLDSYEGQLPEPVASDDDTVEVLIDKPSTPNRPTRYTLTLGSTVGGNFVIFEGSKSYTKNTLVDVSWVVDEGYEFVGYSDASDDGDITGSDKIKMDSDKELFAIFEPIEEPKEEVVILDEEDIPEAAIPDEPLPQTGGVPMAATSMLGIAISGLGFRFRRKLK